MKIFNTVFFGYKQLPFSAAEDANFLIKKVTALPENSKTQSITV